MVADFAGVEARCITQPPKVISGLSTVPKRVPARRRITVKPFKILVRKALNRGFSSSLEDPYYGKVAGI